jgi:hypothetical protein
MQGKSRRMPKGMLSDTGARPGRVEITDPAVVRSLDLVLSNAAVEQIRRLEECLVMAEQRLGTVCVN